MTAIKTNRTFVQGRWGVTFAQYLADRDHVSSHMLETFRRSPPEYHRLYVADAPLDPPPEAPNDAMLLGTLTHLAVLQPAVFDEVTRPGSSSVEAYARLVPALTTANIAAARRMADAVRGHPFARELLEAPGEYEQAVRWRCRHTGLPLKAMFDKMVSAGPTVELKTAADPSPEAFARDALAYGYHRQAAVYQEGRRAALLEGGYLFFVVVGSRPPHEVGVYQLDDDFACAGTEGVAALLTDLRDCLDFDRWGSRWGDGVVDLIMPTA